MGLPEYAEVLRRRWLSVLTVCLLGAVVAVGVSLLGATRSASTTLVIGTAAADGGDVGGELASQRLSTYAELATTPRIAAEVAGDLGSRDAESVQRDLAARVQPDSLLLVITARDRVPAIATAKATSAAEKVVALVDEINPGGPGLTVAQPAALAPPVGLLGAASSALLGAALGLAAGVVLALLRDGTDRRVRASPTWPGPAGGAGGHGAVVLADLAVSSRELKRCGASMPREGSVAEVFRRLRTSLLADGSSRRTVLVTSSQSGEGASEVARGLAVVLARGGLQVALVDAHLRGAGATDARTGSGRGATGGLSAVLRGQESVEDTLVNGGEPGLALLPRGTDAPDAGELLTSGAMAKLLASLHDSADVVVVDVPAVVPFADAAALTAEVGGEAVLVVRSGVTRERDAQAALEELSRARPSRLGVVVLRDPAGRRG